MKSIKKMFCVFITGVLFSCLTTEPEPMVVEKVSWEELAEKEQMMENDNRYVEVEVQFLGPDAMAIPSQALYSQISNVVLMNHIEVGGNYEDGVTTSLDSFLVGLPPGDSADDLMVNGTYGDTIKLVGRTEFIKAGFGLFQHLLLRVETFENLGQ